MPTPPKALSARDKLLDAAFSLIREKGLAATSLDDLCAAAGVTKGALFHHFDSKSGLAVAAAEHWDTVTSAFFAGAAYHHHADPLDRVIGYLEFRKSILKGDLPAFTCLVGTMVQEAYASHPEVRDACDQAISRHADRIEADIAAAMRERGVREDWSAASLALHTQAVLQGAFILAKAKGGPDVAADSVDHLIRYVRMLFDTPTRKQ